MEQMLAVFSAFYSKNLSSETKRGKRQRVMNGEFNGSVPPLGIPSIGYGVLTSFGTNVLPLEGSKLLAISTGAARTPLDPGYVPDLNKLYTHNFPIGFPNAPPGCPVATSAHDSIG